MPDADEEIRTRIIVEAAQAIEAADSARKAIERLKDELRRLKTEREPGGADLEKAIKEATQSRLKEIQQQVVTQQALQKDSDKQSSESYRAMIADKKASEQEWQAFLKSQKKEEITVAKQTVDQRLRETSQQIKLQADLENQTQKDKLQALKESQAAEAEYIRVTKQGYGVMSEAAKQYGTQIQTIKQQIIDQAKTSGQSYQQVADSLAKAGIPINQINQALRELDAQTKKTSGSFRLFGMEIKSVGDIAKAVFTGIFGITVIGILRNIARWFGEVTKSGTEFVRAMFQMEMGIRALQRSGVEITIQDVYENIDRLGKRFGIFSKKELVEGSAALINLVRDFGFTKEQVFELQEAISTLAVVNGRAMDDVQRTVALAISSGYTEGLQRLGVSINRVVIAQKAAALGYAENYMALTELQRAEATRILILERVAKYEEDALKRQDRAAGATDKLNAAWSNFTTTMGEKAARALAGVAYLLATLLGAADELDKTAGKFNIIGTALEKIGDIAAYTAKMFSELWKVMQGKEGFAEALKNLQEFKDNWQRGLEDLVPADLELTRMQEAISKALEDLEKYQEKYAEDIKDIMLDLQRDLEKIERDGVRRRADLQADYFRKLQQITIDAARDVAAANAKYAMDVAQTQRQFAMRRAEAEARYRENEKKAEIRFQEELRRLREGFLFDLEDALHERDARQILRLIRQYNLQKEQATRQYEIEKDERQRAYRLELKELEAQRQERLRILAEEHAARLAAIQAQAEYERQLAQQNYEREKAELEKRLEEQKQERLIRFLQQKQDLDAAREEILKKIGEDLWADLQLTTEQGLLELYKALKDTLGPGGDADKVLEYYRQAMSAASADAIANIKAIAAAFKVAFAFAGMSGAKLSTPVPPSGVGGKGGSTFPYTPVTPGGGRQQGGEVLPGKSYDVAEKGIEVFTRKGTFIPDVGGQVYNQDQFLDLMNKQASRGGDGKVRIGVSLSPDLVGSIIENTLGEVSDVVFELERKRR